MLSVSEQQPLVSEDVPSRKPLRAGLLRPRWLIWGTALIVGVGGGVLIGMLRTSHKAAAPSGRLAGPNATWAVGAKVAPDFSLTDQIGKPVSIRAFRGRPVIVTFIDPLCRNLCPLEAKVLESVETRLPASKRPAILAVSVNRRGDARGILREDIRKWRVSPDWRWAVGKSSALRKVWQAYEIGVQDTPKTVAGITVHEISHTEAAFVIDPKGYQRALYLYPFRAADVARTVQQLTVTQSG